ncbi:hypothetical protein AIOL_002728 [Candidatus Rhodobacter oscarellae]|uniref:Uncharacterized protein n=1 Tax=Candidatus Rhodobacter oscarellae TaxID=1675527 RepID=A0A0J9E4P4_9RHOB|nr:hypothetical protein [Candidatus Rhodobacter lobularis]KMW57760.1 hypothetical protein AIOL_002728 [Candidatus Rhodobacter lobularis]
MEWLIWIGALLSVIGLGGLVWCILIVLRARRANLPEEQMRQALGRVMPLNMAALMLSAFGLMMVVVGILLG